MADYCSASHGQWAGTKNNNILENKQLMEDAHTDTNDRSVPVESDRRCWGLRGAKTLS